MAELGYYYGTHTGMELDNSVDFTQAWENNGVLDVVITGISSLPVTITNNRISVYHNVVYWYLTNPIAQSGEWTVTTADGSLTISGTVAPTNNNTTNIRLTLVRQSNAISTTA